jgi:hypothetical protein
MPAKQKAPLNETLNAYFYLQRIPNLTDTKAGHLDYLWDNTTAAKADIEQLLAEGIGKLLIWCNVIGFPVAYIFQTPFEGSSSLVLQVARDLATVARIERELVGDHEDQDKKGVCTTLLRLKYKYESELEAAGKW